MRRTLLAAAAAVLMAGTAFAQQPDETAMRAARQLGNEGIDLYEKGDYANALDRLQRAHSVLKAPTLGLWYARALAKTGKLVEGSERYLEVSRSAPKTGEPAVFAESRQQATDEHQALQARIPTLQIMLEGATAQEASVSVDGRPLAAMLVGVPVSLNPGSRSVEAKRGTETVTETVTLKEGDKQSVVLRLTAGGAAAAPPPSAAPAAAAPPQAAPAAATSPTADAGVSDEGMSQQTWAYVAFGVGGAGLLTGTITHFMAKGKEGDLDKVCENEVCPTASQGDIDSYNTLTTVATVGMIVGGVGVAAGAVLLFTAPGDSPESPSVAAYVGPASVGVKGVF